MLDAHAHKGYCTHLVTSLLASFHVYMTKYTYTSIFFATFSRFPTNRFRSFVREMEHFSRLFSSFQSR